MGVCASKMKSMAATVDKDAIEYHVRERRVEIGHKTEALAGQWQSKIAAGTPVDVSQAELLPHKDVSHLKLHLDGTTSRADMLKTALYVSTNTIYRDGLKASVWPKLAEGMKKNGLPAQLIQHGQAGANPVIDMALDRQVQVMIADIDAGKSLVNEADVASMKTYETKHNLNQAHAGAPAPVTAASSAPITAPLAGETTAPAPIASAPIVENAPPATAPYNYGQPQPKPEIAPMPIVKSSVGDNNVKPIDSNDVKLDLVPGNEKEIGQGGFSDQRNVGQYEQNQAIRA